MIHRQDTAQLPDSRQAPASRFRRGWAVVVCALVLAGVGTACDNEGAVGPGTLRVGQLGQITVSLETPRRLGFGTLIPAGTLSQTLQWESSGAWTLHEGISYRGLVGDETVSRSLGDPGAFGSEYASLIVRINQVTGLKLFTDTTTLKQGTSADCGPVLSKIRFTIEDTHRGETFYWTQCVDGSLTDLTTVGAGPKVGASRLVVATQQARDATVGPGFVSAYHGSVPFGSLDRGEDTRARPTSSFVVTDDVAWSAFWSEHSGRTPPPEVDFETEIVIVGAVGERGEAGDSVEVRRILEVADGTLAHLFERVPGDFCSPIAKTHYPFHIVVSPRTPAPIRFADILVEYVSCGV